MKTKRFLFLVAFLTSSLLTLSAQNDKPALDHSVYDSWKGFADLQIPYDGNILYYTVREEQGDSFLTYRDLRTDKEIKIERGTHITVDKEGKFALVRISPAYKLTRQEKIDKTPAAKKLQDSLAIVNFSTGVVTKLPNAKSPKYGDNLGRYFAYKMIKDPEEIKEAEEKAAKEAEAKAAQEAEAASGTAAKAAEGTATEATVAEALASKDTTAKAEAKKPAKKKSTKWKRQLVIYDLTKMAQCDTLDNVEAAYFDNKSTRLVCTFSSDAKDKKDTLRAICFYSLKTGKVDTVFTQNKKAYLNGPDLDESGRDLTFLASSDTSKKKSDRPNLYIWSKEGCRILLAADDSRIPEGMGIRTKSTISFSSDSTKFYFALHPIEPEKDTTNALPAFERAKVAVWSWNEPILHTAQSTLMTFAEKSQKYLSRIALDGSGDIVTFEDDTLRSVSIKKDYKTDYVLATTTIPYRLQQQWDRETVYDIYRVNLTDGSREKIREAVKYGGLLPSPDGKWYCWYALEESQWYIYNIETGATRCFTKDLDGIFHDDEADVPTLPASAGSPRWQSDSKAFYIPDKYDIWKIDPTGVKPAKRLTNGVKENRVYRVNTKIYSRVEARLGEAVYIDPKKPYYLDVFDRTTKEHGLACVENDRVKILDIGKYTIYNVALSTKIKGKKPIAIVKGNFEAGNNVWLTKDAFKTVKQITDINPQQRDYNWGTVELVDWTVADGSKAEGLLYKPENFNPEKKYPVIVYFYERYSDDLYGARVPAPSRSVINIPYFVSNGYIVFIPDIRYKTGHPGESAMDYILSGCDKICTYPWVNGEKMGIQGQSWGGYQVAYLVTHTGRFAAAGAGAPVSNMTSAYGGIRWGAGIVRQFQYEQGQSRIGKDLWEGYDLYIENSPIFNVPKVTTPILIMHNDKDTAVPWYQGIEFFTALRRCGKVAWMLQYIGEDHNLRERRNCKDLSVRLGEFFDHYLKDAPMPDWMKYGVPKWSPDALE